MEKGEACIQVSVSFANAQDPGLLASTRSYSYSSYKDKDGRNLGCGSFINCQSMAISVYETRIDRKKKTFQIKGEFKHIIDLSKGIFVRFDNGVAGLNFYQQQRGCFYD